MMSHHNFLYTFFLYHEGRVVDKVQADKTMTGAVGVTLMHHRHENITKTRLLVSAS